MKFLRGFAVSILGICLFGIMFAFAVDLTVKDIFQDQITFKYVKDELLKDNKDELPADFEKEYEKMISSSDTEKLFDTILKDYSDYKKDKKVSDEVVDEIINYIKKHEHEINAISDTKIDIAELESEETRNEIKTGISEAFDDIGDNEDEIVLGINIYRIATSKLALFVLILVMLVFIGLIALVEFSIYKWMRPVGITSIVTSVFVLIFGFGLNFIFEELKRDNININSNITIYLGIAYLVIGILLIVLQSRISNRSKELIKEDISEN